jgi:hypothetical protein
MYSEENSPYLGFIPDFAASATAISPAYIRFVRNLGMPEGLISLVEQVWQEPDDPAHPLAKLDGFGERAAAAGFAHENLSECFMAFGLFGRQEASQWLEIMPQVVHIHGKFHDIDRNGEVPGIPYHELVPVFIEGGYNGYLSSEWEGHFFTDDSGLPMVEKHHAFCKKILSQRLTAPTNRRNADTVSSRM